MGMFHRIVDWTALGIETLAVAVVVGAVVILAIQYVTVRYLSQWEKPSAVESYKGQLGKALLLGLELMVAADLVRTVTFEATMTNVLVLGALVLVRTFLSWTVSVEVEGCWPWQVRTHSAVETARRKEVNSAVV